MSLADAQIIKADPLTFPATEYYTAVTAAIDSYFKLGDAAVASLKTALDQRAAHLSRTQYLLIATVCVIALLAALAGYAIARGVLREMGGEPGYAAEIATRIANGDLGVAVEVRAQDRSSVLHAMSRMQQRLRDIVAGIKTSSDHIQGASAEIAAGNADLSERTEQQASSLEETASSMEELTGTVKQNAENARLASQLAAGASAVAVEGGEVVGQVVRTMSSINESSRKIADIIGVIDGIAFQTNILALNAAVEAARAGEQGRGFAVVASEVRTLAQRSAAAAKEIKTLISDSVGRVEDGSKLVDKAGHTMEEIVTAVKRVTDIMAEIAAASQEQTAGIDQVNQAIVQMDQVTQQNAALVEQAAAAAESMQEEAQSLTEAVAIFKLSSAAGAPHPDPLPRHGERETHLRVGAAQAGNASAGKCVESEEHLTPSPRTLGRVRATASIVACGGRPPRRTAAPNASGPKSPNIANSGDGDES
jgi:methyl-accepting chemotaxis protein